MGTGAGGEATTIGSLPQTASSPASRMGWGGGGARRGIEAMSVNDLNWSERVDVLRPGDIGGHSGRTYSHNLSSPVMVYTSEMKQRTTTGARFFYMPSRSYRYTDGL